jgi:hypothetical protein
MRKAKRTASKAAKTTAKSARFRAAKAKERSAAVLSEQATIEKRAKAYSEMENSVCGISRAATLAMKVFDDDHLFCSPLGSSTSWCSGSGIGRTRKNSPAITSATNRPPAC